MPNGPNGVRMDSLPVSASEPIVRPWKLCSAATITGRSWPCARRTSLIAASFASVPELVKNTRPSMPSSPTSRSASSTCRSCRNRFEVCVSVLACRVIASTMAGCACPSALTAMPPMRSR